MKGAVISVLICFSRVKEDTSMDGTLERKMENMQRIMGKILQQSKLKNTFAESVFEWEELGLRTGIYSNP